MVRTGLDQARNGALPLPGSGRLAVLCNASTFDRCWVPTVDVLRAIPGARVERIFSPQHGFASEKQDNMVESPDERHPYYGIPIESLYAERREPRADSFNEIDALVIDLQDVGTRVYTFLNTALLAIRAAAARGIVTFVLDRPNPIGGAIEGPVLDASYASFVGMIDVPLRHGLTPGEFCRYGARCLELSAEAVLVIPMSGWQRAMFYDETGLPWASPSPNMPTCETALVYPGQVVLEATNLSEGRGTTRPFECWGAPWLDCDAVLMYLETAGQITRRTDWRPGSKHAPMSSAARHGPLCSAGVGWGLEKSLLAGCVLREVAYEPTFHKYTGQRVRGFQWHVRDRGSFRPVAASLAVVAATRAVHPELFAWREPPYEYEWSRLPVDLIYGTDQIRRQLDSRIPPNAIARDWDRGLRDYIDRVAPHLLYGSMRPAGESPRSQK